MADLRGEILWDDVKRAERQSGVVEDQPALAQMITR